MRSAVAAMLMAIGLAPITGLAQEWKAYPYPDAGFEVQLPQPPTVQKATFASASGKPLPMTRYLAQQDHVTYTLSVVDFSGTKADGSSTIAEAEKSLGASGKVTVAIDARVNREFGRELSITGADGSRSAVAIFFVNEHLYTLIGQSLPPNALAHSSDAVRFQQSLEFIGPDGRPAGFGRFGGGRFRGGFNPQALTACMGKAPGDTVQLDGPGGPVAATCTLVARPNRQTGAPTGAQTPEGQQNHAP